MKRHAHWLWRPTFLSQLFTSSNARGVLSQRYHRLRGCRGRGMHRRAIQCNTCGKSFFPASLKFHIPQCIKKQQHLPIPCRYCDQEIKQMDMQIHLKHCTVAKQKMREEKRRRATKGINRAFAKQDTKEQRRLAKIENYTQLSERAARESRNLTKM